MDAAAGGPVLTSIGSPSSTTASTRWSWRARATGGWRRGVLRRPGSLVCQTFSRYSAILVSPAASPITTSSWRRCAPRPRLGGVGHAQSRPGRPHLAEPRRTATAGVSPAGHPPVLLGPTVWGGAACFSGSGADSSRRSHAVTTASSRPSAHASVWSWWCGGSRPSPCAPVGTTHPDASRSARTRRSGQRPAAARVRRGPGTRRRRGCSRCHRRAAAPGRRPPRGPTARGGAPVPGRGSPPSCPAGCRRRGRPAPRRAPPRHGRPGRCRAGGRPQPGSVGPGRPGR